MANKHPVIVGLLAALAVGASACEQVKSNNPLSPTVAGPIAGVAITAPGLVSPAVGSQIQVDKQPVKLTVVNASTNGVRPLSYRFELSTNDQFTGMAASAVNIAPGNGTTSYEISTKLPVLTYYWRARAEDGANTGPYSPVGTFTIVNPPKVTGIAVSPAAISLGDGARTSQLTAVANFDNGDALDVTLQAAWSTSEKNVATVSSSGLVTAQGSGTATITASYQDFTAQATVTVSFAPPPPPPPGPGPSPSPGTIPDHSDLVRQIHAQVNPPHTVEGAFEVTKRVAWALRGEGGGLLRKDGGENVVVWHGISLSASRVCYPDGHIFKVLSDVPATNGPIWLDNGFVDRSLYVPAMDPNR